MKININLIRAWGGGGEGEIRGPDDQIHSCHSETTYTMIKGSQKEKMEIFLLANIKELLVTSRMSHFPPFYYNFSCRDLNLKIVYFILR